MTKITYASLFPLQLGSLMDAIRECFYCNRPLRWLCDYEVRPGTPCDRGLCRKHREPNLKDVHCRVHYQVKRAMALLP